MSERWAQASLSKEAIVRSKDDVRRANVSTGGSRIARLSVNLGKLDGYPCVQDAKYSIQADGPAGQRGKCAEELSLSVSQKVRAGKWLRRT
jgi:hypothetical protein